MFYTLKWLRNKQCCIVIKCISKYTLLSLFVLWVCVKYLQDNFHLSKEKIDVLSWKSSGCRPRRYNILVMNLIRSIIRYPITISTIVEKVNTCEFYINGGWQCGLAKLIIKNKINYTFNILPFFVEINPIVSVIVRIFTKYV